MSEELNELEEQDEEVIEKEEVEESKELTEFEKCIQEYLDSIAERDPFFNEVYEESKIRECCNYIVSEVQKTKRTAFTDDEVYKMARDFYNDNLKAPKGKISATIKVPKAKEVKEEKEEVTQLSLFDF